MKSKNIGLILGAGLISGAINASTFLPEENNAFDSLQPEVQKMYLELRDSTISTCIGGLKKPDAESKEECIQGVNNIFNDLLIDISLSCANLIDAEKNELVISSPCLNTEVIQLKNDEVFFIIHEKQESPDSSLNQTPPLPGVQQTSPTNFPPS